MTVEIALIYDLEGNFIGYSSLRRVPTGAKLTSTNVWEDRGELRETVDRVNQEGKIKQHWPRTDDPDVKQLLNDPNFMPFETTTERVVDEENSYYVWDEVGPDGQPLPGAHLDHQASVLAYKNAVIPVRPAEVQLRFKRAHEIIARRRAGLDDGNEIQWTDGKSSL